MDQEVKAEWVRRLRSGDYEQGRGFLRSKGLDGTPDRYCCLGVLCEMAEGVGLVERFDSGGEYYDYGSERQTCGLPRPVREWSGVETPLGDFLNDGQSVRLSSLNDSGLSFEEIAEVIEREF